MIRALLIDSEETARTDLRAMLAVHPQIEIVGEEATLKAAQALCVSVDYGLVFLDVQLLGGSGFDLVPYMREGAKLIFVTAFSEHAVQAFEVNALDYLLKPVQAERLAQALSRVGQPAGEGVETQGEPVSRAADLMRLSSGSSSRFAAVADLSAIEAEGNYSMVRLRDGTTVLVRRSLKAWEDMLPRAQFMRVHRMVIVNLAHVAGYRRSTQKAITLRLQGVAEALPVSRLYWAELKLRLPGEVVGSSVMRQKRARR